MLIGYDGGGLYDSAGRKLNLSEDVVTNLYYDNTKDVTYISTYGEGIYYLKGNKIERLKGAGKDSPIAFSRHMTADREGNLWIGTFSNGLGRYSEDGRVSQFQSKDYPLGSNCIVGIDRRGNTLWVSSTAGLCRIDLGNMKFNALPLPANISIKAFKLDRSGRPWVASDNYILTPDQQKLPIANTRALTFDLGNNCWLTASDGMNVVLSSDSLNNDYRYYHFPARIAGGSSGFSKYSLYTKRDGNILAGMFGAYLEFSPSALLKICDSSVKISSIDVNRRPASISENISLSAADTLNINLTSLNYIIPRNGRFVYRLLPDSALFPVDNAHISLTGLDAGCYKLHIKELNSGAFVTLDVRVRHPLSFYLYIGVVTLISIIILIIVYIIFFKKLRRPDSEDMPLADKQFLEKLESILQNELGNTDFTIESLASEMGMSRSNLYKKISSLTGKSPLEFLRDKRIAKGKQLLDEGHSHIGQVAYSVGLSPKQFSKFFKEKYGTLPSDYIRPPK